MEPGDVLRDVKSFADGFAGKHLAGYVKRLRSGSVSNVPKEINDAVWGTIKVSPLEVVVIDSPLFQRLRLVRQLGVVHWIYPGATHTRFEHSLGVLHQAQQLVNAINLAYRDVEAPPPINNRKTALVRLCALVHDLGHGLFSHVSEHALSRRLDVKAALHEFAESEKLGKVQLSELMAYYFVGSPAFVEMLTVALDKLNSPISFGGSSAENAGRLARLAQQAIVGRHIDEEIPLLHEIITGPFDADKLDYYYRDAIRAGIPSILDISRLLQKITCRRVSSQDMPEDILAALREKHETRYLFGLKWSGVTILDELQLARVLLYAKIYRHKKVQAIESMVEALIAALGSVPDVSLVDLIRFCYECFDDQLLSLSASTVIDLLNIKTANAELGRFVDDTIIRLRDRDLYVSALSVLPKYPEDPWGHAREQVRGLDELVLACKNDQTRKDLAREITLELKDLLRACPEAIGALNPDVIDFGIVISSKPPLGSGTEIDRALVLQNDKFVRERELNRINHPAWADAYDFGSPQAVVFAPRECAAAVYVASERLIRKKYGVVLPPVAPKLSKQDEDVLSNLKKKLENSGWYTGIPMDIRPRPERLRRQDVDSRIQRIAVRLETIDEPKGTIAPRRAPALNDRIHDWLAQFRDDDLIECALIALEKMIILGREESYSTLSDFLVAHPEFRGATVCPLGELKDSGAIQAYLSRDLHLAFPVTCTIEEAVTRGIDKPVVFIDDFIASGNQVSDILGNWFEEPALQKAHLKEGRLPFNEAERRFLLSRPIAFVFLAAWNDGLETIQTATKRLGIDATVYAHLTDDKLPFAFDGALAEIDPVTLSKFRDRCEKIGEALIRTHGGDEPKQRDRALGYGNRAMLLTSRFNVPTQTLTCFWLDGKFDGVDWHALIRRRPKK